MNNEWKFKAPSASELVELAHRALYVQSGIGFKQRCADRVEQLNIRAEKPVVSASIRARLIDMTKDVIICEMMLEMQ